MKNFMKIFLIILMAGIFYQASAQKFRNSMIRFYQTYITKQALTMGTDGSGLDVIFYSSTAGDYFFWDASEESLILIGTDGQDALSITDGDLNVDDDVDFNRNLDVDGYSQLDSTTIAEYLNINGPIQQSVTGVSGYSYNLLSLTHAGDGSALRGFRVNLTSPNADTVLDMQNFHGYLTMGTTPVILANSAIYPLSSWLDVPDGATVGSGTVIAGLRAIFDPNNNDLTTGGVESALFYGQTWASTGTIDAGLFMSAGAGSTIDAAIELGSGTFGSIMDFTSWGADTFMPLIIGGPKDAAELVHFKVYIGDQTTRAGVQSETGGGALGSLYLSTAGKLYICTSAGTWERMDHTAQD